MDEAGNIVLFYYLPMDIFYDQKNDLVIREEEDAVGIPFLLPRKLLCPRILPAAMGNYYFTTGRQGRKSETGSPKN
ncbi:MAG: hypothetical protein LBD37_06545 [Treponema sp.]|nr:hypothetical protein [Treponema sp.]